MQFVQSFFFDQSIFDQVNFGAFQAYCEVFEGIYMTHFNKLYARNERLKRAVPSLPPSLPLSLSGDTTVCRMTGMTLHSHVRCKELSLPGYTCIYIYIYISFTLVQPFPLKQVANLERCQEEVKVATNLMHRGSEDHFESSDMYLPLSSPFLYWVLQFMSLRVVEEVVKAPQTPSP